MAGHFLSQGFGVPIVHDLTNWLRIGDVTFLRFNQNPPSHRFQTLELKSSIQESRVTDAGMVEATVTVNVYSNEPLELPSTVDKQHNEAESDVALRMPSEENLTRAPYRQDRRLVKQLRRLDQMVALRDMKDDSIATIDGIPNLMFRVPHADTHHWSDFRRAIRKARRDGYAFFSIDDFIGYGVHYREEGVTEEHVKRFLPLYAEHVENKLLPVDEASNRFLLIRQIPMLEEYDTEGFPIMRFFSYDIPQIAVTDLLRNRLLVAVAVNFGRIDSALVDHGFTVSGINADREHDGYPYSIVVAWEGGETFRVQIPMTYVSREVERALYEFSGLDDIIQHVAAVKRLPEMISYEEWEASLKSQATEHD